VQGHRASRSGTPIKGCCRQATTLYIVLHAVLQQTEREAVSRFVCTFLVFVADMACTSGFASQVQRRVVLQTCCVFVLNRGSQLCVTSYTRPCTAMVLDLGDAAITAAFPTWSKLLWPRPSC